MKLTSPEFENDGMIPDKFTCDGDNINPALDIENIPAGAKSLVLIVDDPDSVKGLWIHWVVYDIPIVSRIEKNSVPGTQGMNDFGRTEYGGPCPHTGTHRYRFKMYALDAELGLDIGATIQDVEYAMVRHIVERDILTGMYQNRTEREAAGVVR